MSIKQPPVSVDGWLSQVKQDPSIPAEFKNGKEDQLKVTDTAFQSGSLLNSTQFLHLRIIWQPHFHITSLGDLMKDDPKIGYLGFVSEENINKAASLFNEKGPKWRQYINEVGHRATGAVPRQTMRPSEDCGPLWHAVHYQTQVRLRTSEEDPTTEEVERAYAIVNTGNAHVQTTIRPAGDQHITPITPNARARRKQGQSNPIQSTPEVASYQPARGGKFNKPAADEEIVNSALLSFLNPLTGLIGNELASLNWLGSRLPLRLNEVVFTTNPDTGIVSTELRPIMEARVDGYLSRMNDPFGETLNEDPLAIIEVKPFTLGSAISSIRRQVGAEMASWISQAGESTAGLLQISESGRKRRLMITQYRHEIYVVIGEYGAGFEAHIRPSRSVLSGSTKPSSEATKPPPGRSNTEFPTQEINQPQNLGSILPSRPTDLYWASPATVRRVEDMGIEVSGDPGADRRNPQPTQHPAGTRKSTRKPGGKWKPDVGDFLVMHEFGPFITTDPSHMELFIRRCIPLMLQLRGPQKGFIPDTVSTRFLDKPELGEAFALGGASSSGPTLRKPRSFGDKYEKPRWQG